MSKLIINGPVKLKGSITIRGAKNATLPILIAAALSDQDVALTNVPTEFNDVSMTLKALEYIGCRVTKDDGIVKINAANIAESILPEEISSKFRYSLLFLGLLAARRGHSKVYLPGGCKLGERKFDLHLEGLRALGANVELTDDAIEVYANNLKGADINFYLPTTSGTENIILAACFAKGRTRIFNANTRPEIVDLGKFLNQLGAKVSVKNRMVEVEGPVVLSGGPYNIMPGWDEAVTYMLAAGMTLSEICIQNFNLDYIQQDVAYMRQAGIEVFQWGGNVYVSGKNKSLKPFDLFTAPYPGVNSDMQPLFAALASQCQGESTITDQRFTDRFQYVNELKKLGVKIDSYGNCAVITGPSRLKGTNVSAIDLRCGASLVLSALAADGTTRIDNTYQLYRGYENITGKLIALGADICEE
ncbi:MAG: UDP-N-acetylglucosamine 1-carboxyvinyltransferase [Phycisphaerae bacterium]|nr:UDP-N-acetylglucosamine 1-carboxyvinyltransferase [Phycisphaerae bacterium]